MGVTVPPMKAIYVNILLNLVYSKNPYLGTNERRVNLVDYRTHVTHCPQNVLQIGTLKSLKVQVKSQIGLTASYLKGNILDVEINVTKTVSSALPKM